MGATGSSPIERYEYDAYGNCQIMDASYNPHSSSLYGNPYYFAGRETDSLDSGNLKIMNYRHRTYDTYTGRFLTHDPHAFSVRVEFGESGLRFVRTEVGRDSSIVDPHDEPGTATMVSVPAGSLHYAQGMNLYDYPHDNPLRYADPSGYWGKDVHYSGTVRWASSPDVRYRHGGCAEILGTACNAVDSGDTAPRPWGDFSYHFEPGRYHNYVKHRERARKMLESAKISYHEVATGLKELGTALHPWQDSFSHIASHEAATPWDHAPKQWCFFTSGWIEPYPGYCKEQSRKTPTGERVHENWDDPHRPDKVRLWISDHTQTRIATQKDLKEFIKYPCVCARCRLGLMW
jgi:hypothetical protein